MKEKRLRQWCHDRVRPAEKGDLPEILRLYSYLKEEPVPAISPEIEALWRDILRDENQTVLVAERDGRLVSSCTIVIVKNLTHGQRPYALVENVVTDPDYRKQGFASACLDRAKQKAQQEQCYKIMLLTGSEQESTLAFYEHAGYNRRDKTAFIQWLASPLLP